MEARIMAEAICYGQVALSLPLNPY